jgi:hypothetical protein
MRVLGPAVTSAAMTPYSPAQIRHAYGFDKVSATGMGQKIAIVNAYGNQNIQSDLNTFCNHFGIKTTTVRVIGSNPGGKGNGWDLETSLDVQWAHVVAPDATIILSVAPTENTDDLLAAVDAAVAQGANVVSMSWGATEWSSESAYDTHFNVPNVCFVAASGDSGELPSLPEVYWPAVSPYVIGVGGTSLYLDSNGNRVPGPTGFSEIAWSGSGGGLSIFYNLASWQSGWFNATWPKNRGVPDVSYVADPNTGVYVYCSTYFPPGWYQVGGTSAGAPQWAALIALANQGRTTGISGNGDIYNARVAGIAPTIEALNFHDISSGSNGSDADDMSVVGYDLVTGLGSPVVTGLIPALATPPVVTAPANVTIACTASLNPSVNNALGTATAVNGCGGTSTPTYSDQIIPGNCAGNYTVNRTWSSQDGCGNTGTALQTITVQDTVVPAVTAPPNVTVACTASLDPSVNNLLGTATAVDGCSGASTPTYSDQVIPGNCAGNYTVNRTWSSQDGCGNTGTASQTITVQDTTPPNVTAPADLVLSYTADTSTNSTGVATAQDGCSGVTVTYSDAVTNPGDGTEVTARTWVATDGCGNTASATQIITVNAPLALILPAPSNINATDLVLLTITNTAANPNGSNNALAYQLINPPAGATIDTNGIITWTPTLAQSPSTNIITTVVTTTVVNSLGSTTITTTNSFVVSVSGPYDGLDMLADSDGDGLPNLVEVALGGDPLNPADANDHILKYITQDSGNQYLAMKYKARINAAALQLLYLPEVSADNVAWESDTNHVLVTVTPLDSVFNSVTARDTTPITATQARFIRLHIILSNFLIP